MTKRADDSHPSQSPLRWQLLALPWQQSAFILSVDVAALVVMGITLRSGLSSTDFLRFGVLSALGVIYLESSHRLARQRFLFAVKAPHTNLSSVWTLAGAIVLPLDLAALLVVITNLYMWFRVWSKLAATKPYRVVYSSASMVLSCVLSGAVFEALGSRRGQLPADLSTILHALAAVGAYYGLSLLLISLAVLLVAGRSALPTLFGNRAQLSLELTAQLLGAITAVLVVYQAWFVLLVAPILLVIERAAHTQHFQEAASLDSKTGLLNATAWQVLAERGLAAAAEERRTAAVLIIDLDHFKRINDGFGHLVGDIVLHDVARALTVELRGYDLIGRFGGEEFVAFLPGADLEHAREVGDRIRRCVHGVTITGTHRDGQTEPPRVSTSVGVSVFPTHGSDLPGLLTAADFALYHAKESGRDRVTTASTARA